MRMSHCPSPPGPPHFLRPSIWKIIQMQQIVIFGGLQHLGDSLARADSLKCRGLYRHLRATPPRTTS
ncbi:hypothetical protein CBM2592_A160040 [Cupriavidus taiwanensis]|nr:hypothetical protein CBM2592_A160040 [Cupriavidus taiwanensis]SOY81102.1 hypothetical protein CBM2591_A190040 [Cupriavidus taiwanensis]SOZ21945.1 hypothetical protein CBM2608_A160118 [Cupriavidus taiwanensis]SOZ53426.1 hypothetical protein CBM2617_A160118 [Cupriavidus taiwanensis]SOZ77609.1 hypothetical protein CBM2622_A150118 [Cupriavidus taiwanensis]